MIPTSFAVSSPPTAAASGGSGFLSSTNNSPLSGNSTSSTNSNGSSSSNNNSALLGIASLILEGRALAEDEYAVVAKHQEVTALTYAANAMDCGRQSPKPSTSRAAAFYDHHYAGLGAGGGSVGMNSTGTSATNTGGNLSSDIASYLRRKASNSPESAHSSSSLLRDYYSNSSSESAASSVDSNHSRWTQKLSQLRQESPSAQHHHLAAAREQKVAVECVRSSEPEYVALAINTDPNNDEHRRGGDFEIIRRIALNRINLYNTTTPSSTSVAAVGSVSGVGSSENFMCSLQTLASSTCLRVGTPILSNSMVTSSTPKYSTYRVSPPTPRFPTPQHTDVSAGSASSCGSVSGSGHSPRNSTISWHPSTATPVASTNRDYLLCKASTARISIPTPQNTPPTNSSTISSSNSANAHQLLTKRLFGKECSSAAVSSSSTPTSSRNNTTSANATATATTIITTTTTSPQQGPHCDQFLRKMGLAKGDASETEEHHCDMSYVNITCTRWRAYCIKMENIIARGEPLCIEVYLGPVGHKILLEQWIITVKEKQPPPTMTLPSLCSAIRSQLYFSQISAWCDLIKKSDKTIYDTGRLILSTSTTTSAAGDLATTTATLLSTSPSTGAAGLASPVSSSSGACNMHGGTSGIVGCTKRRSPRLNIFYRIKPHDDNTIPACFNTKPNVHNFPNVNISENCCVSVCLKSLPRITGGIPKVGSTTAPAVAAETTTIAATTAAAAAIIPNISPVATTTTRPSTTMISTSKATTSKSLGANVFKTKPAAAIGLAATIANMPTTRTTVTINCDNKTSKEQHHPQQQQQKQHPQQQTKTAVFNVFHEMMNHRNHLRHECEKDAAYANDDSANDDDHDFDGECDRNMCAAIDAACSSGCIGIESVGGGDGDSSNSSFSTNYGNISHREKQLLKYRKRMLKRDKKQRKTVNNECASGQLISAEAALKMEQGDDDGDINADDGGDIDREPGHASAANNVQNTTKGQRQQQQLPKSFINSSIPFTNLGQQSRQQSEESQQHHVKMISTGTQTTTNTCASCGFEKSMICLKCNPFRNPAADTVAGPKTIVNMNQFNCFDNDENMDAETASISSSTSTSACSLSSNEIIHTPRNKAELLLQAIQRTPKANKKHKKGKDIQQHLTNIKQSVAVNSSSPPLTPTSSSSSQPQQSSNNNNRLAGSNPSSRSSSSSHTNTTISSDTLNGTMQTQGCQVCKRQKTQHNFQTNTQELDDACVEDKSSVIQIDKSTSHSDLQNQTNGNKSDNVVADIENDSDGGKMSSRAADCVDNGLLDKKVGEALSKSLDLKLSPNYDGYNNQEIMEEEYFTSSTKLTPYIERCSLASKMYYRQQQHQPSNYLVDSRLLCSTPPLIEQQQNNDSGGGNNKGLLLAQFKTPTPGEQQQNKSDFNRQLLQQPYKLTPKPNLLQIACNFNGTQVSSKAQDINQQSKDVIPSIHNPILLRRNSPKVNLTPIFCNPSSMMGASSNPIPIGNSMTSSSSFLGSKSAEIQVTHASPTFSFESHGGPPPTITVQKSNSAPTLPNSPSLSPRFVKASALYKRRSRHLSDRSDRSSLGSDEQFSDEDIDCGMYSPFATSPVKSRIRLAAVFGRKPFLGNLEESLLQRRLVPKIEVMGFKLLLGASGGFCPTQLTLPAAAYFYELKGETLSTPYLCEIRLPRKGYNVPRSGTVQATLLNPMGTVVRMFVIPYDMRDMPALHQTFIRQRILADTGDANGSRTAAKQTTSPGVGNRAAVGDGVEDSGDAIMQNGNMINSGAGNDYATINKEKEQHQQRSVKNSSSSSNNNNNNNHNLEDHLGHFISAENMKSLRYSIHLRFQTSRSGRLMLHSDIRLLISRRTDCDTAAAHAKGVLEAPNELITNTVMPTNPKYSARQEQTTSSKI